MCGIVGIIQPRPGRFTKEVLKKMTVCLAHRGPDGDKVWENSNGKALFGHRRLAIIDLAPAASQPMHYMDRYTIIHNGEIYNYIELKEDLRQKGYSFQTHSDTEVILAAYDHYGDECVEHFDGMFAFAIWDEEEQELFAARDRFGEKPFYYCLDKDALIFASELKAIWAAGVERVSNLKLIFNFITIGYTDNPARPEETFFENVVRLPAASRLFYTPSSNELEIEKYWNIDLDRQQSAIDDEEAIEKFTDLFSQSVNRRLRSDVPIGTSLSGGLDSSSVVAVASTMSEQMSPPLASFTARFPGFSKDESHYANIVTTRFGLKAHYVDITVDDFVNDWEIFLHHQEEPFGSASAYAQYKVFALAKDHGIKVLLDGQGADETLAGYSKYYKWYWQELFQQRKLMKSNELKAAAGLGVAEKFRSKNVIAALFPDIASVILERQYLVNALRHEDLTRDFIRRQSQEAYYSTPSNFDLNGALYFNTCVHGLEELLRHADRNAMAHGREVRLPFLNHHLVEFIFSLPSHFKIRKGWTKWLLRQSMSDKLPSEITWRKDKVGFEPPQKEWMEDPRVREMVQEARRKLVDQRILRSGILEKPLSANNAHEGNNYDWRYLAAAAFL
ncbi:MAG: asparagine synthase (glutamine-hydrolyzing) [Chitinophagaceae bacterium]|nr:asparagine synthase (glutamine-hydrolyzing) [Chitinophagaceae bacterium]